MCSNVLVVGVLWPNGLPWTRQASPRRRWYRHGPPWGQQHLHLDELTDDAGGWRVSWSQRRTGDLVYDTLDEAMSAVAWVLGQGGTWVEVDPYHPEQVVGDGPAPWRPGHADPLSGQPDSEQV